MKSEVSRNLNNFAVCPTWTAFFTQKEVEELIDTSGDFVFCCGTIRDFVIDKITENRFKVTTKKREFN